MKNKLFNSFTSFCRKPQNGVYTVILFTIVAWSVQCSLLQSVLGLDILEALSWGTHGDIWGNTKHPPLSGWIACFFHTVSGGHDWSLYLAAQLCLAVGIFFTYKTAKLFLDEYASAAGAVLLCSCYYYCPSLLKFSTFFVETALMPVIAYCFFTAMRKKSLSSYLVLAVVCALAFLNKYSIGLLFISIAVLMFTTKEYRAELKTYRPYLAAVVFCAIISPHINWLVHNDFVCLGHVGNRLHEKFKWYEPLAVAATGVYPTAMAFAVLVLSALPLRKSLERCGVNKDVFKWSCMFTAIPAAILFASSLCGNSVITMWFSTLASFSGILAVSLFPCKITDKLYRNTLFIVLVYMICFFAGTTVDLAVKSRPRLHMDTQEVLAHADAVWQKHCPGKPMKFVVGDRWYGNIVSLYHQEKPVILEMDKELKNDWKRRNYIEKSLKHGAIVIGRKEELFKEFADELAKKSGQKLDFTRKYECHYQALLGKKKSRKVFITVIRAQQ